MVANQTLPMDKGSDPLSDLLNGLSLCLGQQEERTLDALLAVAL